jgi:hypothetical protein
MATVQVDETEFLASQGTLKALQGMLANPEARKLVLKARKISDPTASIPEIDAAEPVNKEIQALKDQFEALKAERAAAEEAAKVQAHTDSFINSWKAKKTEYRDAGYNTDYVESVEKLAQERGIADFDAAAALFDKMNPKASISEPTGFGRSGLFGLSETEDDYTKNLVKYKQENGPFAESDSMLMGEVDKVLTEIRGSRR